MHRERVSSWPYVKDKQPLWLLAVFVVTAILARSGLVSDSGMTVDVMDGDDVAVGSEGRVYMRVRVELVSGSGRTDARCVLRLGLL